MLEIDEKELESLCYESMADAMENTARQINKNGTYSGERLVAWLNECALFYRRVADE